MDQSLYEECNNNDNNNDYDNNNNNNNRMYQRLRKWDNL